MTAVASLPAEGSAGGSAVGGRERRDPPGVLLVGVFAAVGVVMTFPNLARFGNHVAGDAGDSLLTIWIMRSAQIGMLHGWHTFWDARIYYPHLDTTAYSDTLLPVALIDLPLRTVFGDVVAFNLIYLSAWTASCWFAYRLARQSVGYWGAAFVASLIYTYSTVHLVAALHFQLVVGAALVPVSVLVLLWCLDRPSWRRGVLYGVVLSALILTASYYGAMMLVVTGFVSGGVVLITRPNSLRRVLGAMVPAVGVAFALAAPIGIKYLLLERDPHFRRPFAPVAATHLTDFLAVASRSYFAAHVPIIHRFSSAATLPMENRLFPGFVAVVFAAIGAAITVRTIRRSGWRTRPNRDVALLALAGVFLLVCSFGDYVIVAGHHVFLPYWFLRRTVPGFAGLRALPRLMLGFQLALALLAAVGINAAVSRFPRSRALLTAGLSIVVLAESAIALSFVRVPTSHDDGGFDQLLSARAAGAVLEFPIQSDIAGIAWPFTETPRQLLALRDGHPRVNGYSGFEPKQFGQLTAILDTFPSRQSFAELHHLGVRYVVLRTTAVDAMSDPGVRQLLDADGAARITDAHARRMLRALPPREIAHLDQVAGGYLIELKS